MIEKVKLTRGEKWKDVEGYEGIYQVSDRGRLRSVDRVVISKNGVKRKVKGRLMKQSTSNYGYKVITLRKGEIKKSHRVHRLVAESFINKEEGKTLINHKDGDKCNNRAENLEWCTNSENMKHAFKSGLKQPSNPNKNGLMQGESHSRSKLTERDVLFIRKNAKVNGGEFSNVELASKYNVTKSTIGYIVKEKTWVHL